MHKKVKHKTVWEKHGESGNPAFFSLPFQSLTSPRAVTSPQPCRGTTQSCTASWRCLKAKVSRAGKDAGGLRYEDGDCWGLLSQQAATGAGSRGEMWEREKKDFLLAA